MTNDAWCIIPSPIGPLRLAAHHGRLTGIVILAGAGRQDNGFCVAATPSPDGSEAILAMAAAQLVEYFAGRRQAFDLPLSLEGVSPFARRVLGVLGNVPYGTSLTYGQLAAQAGTPPAARAVGRVMAANPLPIVIPCHRVVAAGGRPGGYSGGGGLPTKEWLLAFEGRHRPAN